MICFSKEQIILLHDLAISETGGTPGLRDSSLLESALGAPFQTFDGEDLYPSIYQKAARLGFGLAQNHAFIDGNKRIGALTMISMLEANNIEITYTQNELVDLFLKISNSLVDVEFVTKWIIDHIQY